MAIGERFPDVLAGARAGAQWAWSAIYRELAPSVTGYLRARNVPDPDDVAGEVFLQVVRDLHTFEGDEGRFRSWVFTIAHHRLLDARRTARRKPAEPTDQHVLASAGPSGDVEADAMGSLSLNEIVRLFERLPSTQQDVLLLRVIGGLTVDEAARAVGKSPGAVKALQRRGLEALRRSLEKDGVTLWTIAALTWAR